MDLTFYFVVEGLRLQSQAVLLAASLARHHPETRRIAYLPEGSQDDLPEAFRAIMAGFGVELCRLSPPDDAFKGSYPHGNKILAAAEPRETCWSVFLDTDMVMVRPLLEEDLPGPMQVSVVPEGILGWGVKPERWERVYGHFGLPVPEERVRMLRGARRYSPPYFNAGLVAFREGDLVDGKRFGQLWRDTAQEIDWQVSVGAKRPWLDQVSLPVAMARSGFVHRIVDERNNTSISNGRKLDGLDPSILHYHRAAFLRAWPEGDALVAAALDAIDTAHRAFATDLLTAGGFIGPEEAP